MEMEAESEPASIFTEEWKHALQKIIMAAEHVLMSMKRIFLQDFFIENLSPEIEPDFFFSVDIPRQNLLLFSGLLLKSPELCQQNAIRGDGPSNRKQQNFMALNEKQYGQKHWNSGENPIRTVP